MYRDRVQEALKIAAAPTLEEMRALRKTLPPKLAKLVTYLVNHLFDLKLTATLAWERAGITDHSLSPAFHQATGRTLSRYIERRRLEVADRMIRNASGVELGWISLAVGYEHHGTFLNAYGRWLEETPTAARRDPGPPEIDYLVWRRGWRGRLDEEEAWGVCEAWVRVYPSLEERLRERYGSAAEEPWIEVDGARHERWSAEGYWQELRGLAFGEQLQRIRRVRFHSTAFFDLLRKRSREQGRRDRRRGVELAELALASLEGCDDIFGERMHDLRALGWAWLSNAHRLALDLPAASAAFEQSDMNWSAARAPHEPRVAAEIDFLRGTLRMCQRSYDAALELVDRSGALSRLAADLKGQIQALTQRAAICGYAGRPEESIVALEKAVDLLETLDDPYLAFAVWGNLANAQARAGQYSAASESLERARALHGGLDYPAGVFELEWVEGNIEDGLGNLQSAERLYVEARRGFARARESGCFSLASLDLAVLYTHLDAWPKVKEIAVQTLPILRSLQLHEETVAAVSLLAEATAKQELTAALLGEARDRLERDPLTRIAKNEDRDSYPVL